MVRHRKRRGRRPRSGPSVVEAFEPNDAWSIDFKGWFRVGDGTRCDSLTVNDMVTRASLELRAMVAPKLEDVQYRLEELFWQQGLPGAMLSDNWPPFASRGIDARGGLAVSAFSRFKVEYNDERPHEALGMRTPGELYVPSERQMPFVLPEHEYDEAFEIRRVRRDGSMKWGGGCIFVGEALAGELIGVEDVDDGHWYVHLGPMRLGVLHERSRTVMPLPAQGE